MKHVGKNLIVRLAMLLALLTLSGCYLAAEPDDYYDPDPAPPFVEGQSAQLVTYVNSAFTYQLTCNTNVGDPCQFTLINTPLHGTLQLVSSSGQIVYTPDPGYVGYDNFDFQTQVDDLVADAPATITIQINPVGTHHT